MFQELESLLLLKLKTILQSKILIYIIFIIILILSFIRISNYKSSLTLKDEFKICNLICYLKIENIDYKKLKKVDKPINSRYEEKIKKVLNLEINKLYENNNVDKINYLYYEWFKREEDDIKKIINKMQKKLLLTITNDEKKIYNLIIKTYKVV